PPLFPYTTLFRSPPPGPPGRPRSPAPGRPGEPLSAGDQSPLPLGRTRVWIASGGRAAVRPSLGRGERSHGDPTAGRGDRRSRSGRGFSAFHAHGGTGTWGGGSHAAGRGYGGGARAAL